MIKLKKTSQLFLMATVFIISCSKSNEETLNAGGGSGGGNNTCDTVNIKFTTGVLPILKTNCYSCHGNGQINAGVNFDTYAGVKAVADNGRLIGVITHAQGFSPMPKGLPKLSDCNINKIRSWIGRGALDN